VGQLHLTNPQAEEPTRRAHATIGQDVLGSQCCLCFNASSRGKHHLGQNTTSFDQISPSLPDPRETLVQRSRGTQRLVQSTTSVGQICLRLSDPRETTSFSLENRKDIAKAAGFRDSSQPIAGHEPCVTNGIHKAPKPTPFKYNNAIHKYSIEPVSKNC